MPTNRKPRKTTAEALWGETDDQGHRPDAALTRVRVCRQYGMAPAQDDLDTLARHGLEA